VSGGPYRSDATVFAAIDHCIGSGKPFLGTCSGFQYACLALARRQGIDAVHAELDPEAENPLIGALACTLYGEERLVVPVRGSRLAAICGLDPFPGYHYCGFGLAPEHEPTIERAGVLISARADDAGAEAIELLNHPFFLATAFQPQVGSSATGVLHPLLIALLDHARASSGDRTLGSSA
jgi:CTP synthase (UTP-ammonia lyase)